MAQLTGTPQAFHSDTSIVDTTQQIALGTRGFDASGNEYIYLTGVGSTAAGNWVVYDESYLTTLLVANEVGPVAIAMAAIDATTKFGWYQIYGKNTIAKTDTVAADNSLYIDGTAGRADDAGVAGDLIIGAYSMTADTANVATVMLSYPSVSNDIGGASGTVGGSDTQVQFNDGNTLSGEAGFTYNKTTDSATLVGSATVGTGVLISTNDAGAIGASGTAFSDLFLASGAVIDFAAGNSVITHSSAVLTVSTGDLRVTTAGTNAASVVTVGGTQTLTSKTLTSPSIGTSMTGSYLTASEILITDGSKNIVSAAVATYPSLTELTYVKGVTSAIQTQINTKAPSTAPTFATSITGSYLTASEILITDGSKNIVSAAVATYPSLTELTYVKGVTSAIQTQLTARLPLAGGTMTGNITLGENTSVDLDPAGSADGKYSGICITGTAGATLAFGDLIYLAVADSRWELTDADATATAGTPLIGMCVLAAAADADPTKILLFGTIRADAKFPALTIGAPVYVGETAGAIQVAIPTGADNVIRVVGRALTADEILFNPSQDHQITVA